MGLVYYLSIGFFPKSDFNIFLGLNERKINPFGAHVISIDFNSIDDLAYQIKEIKPSLIIHTASLTSVEKWRRSNPDLAYSINVELSSRIAYVAQQFSIPLIHISHPVLWMKQAYVHHACS